MAERATTAGAGSAVAAHLTTSDEWGGSIPTSALHLRKIPRHVAKAFLMEHHYLRRVPAVQRIHFGVFESDSFAARMIGVMSFGNPLGANRMVDGASLFELTRMCILDVTTKNAESRCLAIAGRLIKQRYPWVIGLVAYSDLEGQGHKGTIYKAAGWHNDHVTQPISWSARGVNRRDRGSNTTKLRWRKDL